MDSYSQRVRLAARPVHMHIEDCIVLGNLPPDCPTTRILGTYQCTGQMHYQCTGEIHYQGGSAILSWLKRQVWVDDDVLRYVVRVSIWGRWLIFFFGVILLAYRPSLWYPENIEHLYLHGVLAIFNGALHYRSLTNRPVTWRWMLALSAIDIAQITGHVAINGGLDELLSLVYFPALGIFAMVFASIWLGLAWTTVVAVVYTLVITLVDPGLDVDAGDDRVLWARLVAMYIMVLGISLIVRYERRGRQTSMARERRVQQERIDQSQAIHDTTAQTAYMIGLGLEGAIKMAGQSNPRLVEKLEAIASLSRSAMWELRSPIDMGHIFEARELGRVLGSHTATFSKITSIPAEMVQSGDEPQLATETRVLLFTISHNALTNAFLHARPSKVEVRLDFEANCIRLSVSDDGVGLPEDFAERGRGYKGMTVDAEKMGGNLIVTTEGEGRGTTVTCVVPLESSGIGD